jgi:hypothetical protein
VLNRRSAVEHAERLLRKYFRSGFGVGTLLEWGLG